MTPAARVQAAIEVLDQWFAGEPAERALINWGRASRYAGSGDRLAVRDHVYDALRHRLSYAWLGGSDSGRGLMLGALRLAGSDPVEVFTGEGHAPAPVGPEEAGNPLADAPDPVRFDCPDWLFDRFGPDASAILARFQTRAPTFLRVNLRRQSLDAAQALLASEGIVTRPHSLSPSALEVLEGARKISTSNAYLDGSVELQDVASQAVVDALGISEGLEVLDYCAGGGGKSLALAALGATVTAHDSNAQRTKDIAPRAARAKAKIKLLTGKPTGTWPLVLVDAPCSGSGTWSRDPESKWRLTPARLDEICALQARILRKVVPFVAIGGRLAYVTCSLFAVENEDQITSLLRDDSRLTLEFQRRFSPLDGGDGFSVSILSRNDSLK